MHEERDSTAGPGRGSDELESTPSAVVRTVGGELEAEAIRTALESAGIPVRIKMESVAKLIAVTVDGLGKVEVLVPPERLEEARAVLDSVVDPDELVEEALAGSERSEDPSEGTDGRAADARRDTEDA
jgi:hypothetical protein